MKNVVVVGIGHPDVIRVINAINRTNNQINFLGFLDDKIEVQGKSFWGYPVLGTLDWLKENKDNCFVVSTVALTTKIRKQTHKRILSFGAKFTSLIDPTVDVSHSKIGEGVILYGGVIVAPNAVVGDHVIASFNSVIGHDSYVGNFSYIATGAKILGAVKIGDGVFLGANASCYPKIKIGNWSTISMCASVMMDIPENVTVIGNPGKIMRKIDG